MKPEELQAFVQIAESIPTVGYSLEFMTNAEHVSNNAVSGLYDEGYFGGVEEAWKLYLSDPNTYFEAVVGIAGAGAVSKVSKFRKFDKKPNIGTTKVAKGNNKGSTVSSGVGTNAYGNNALKYSPINPGPLADDVAKTFRGATYTQRSLVKNTTLYRTISNNGNPAGSFWTSKKPHGPLQSVVDSALDQNWGNTATRVVKATFPAGTKVYEGVAAAQRGLVGGGNQIYIPKVDTKWIQ
jgi:hypothetical protein